MFKITGLIVLYAILAGCGALQQKGETVEDVGEMVLNPEQVHIEYHRNNGVMTFKHTRCTGSLCDEESTETRDAP